MKLLERMPCFVVVGVLGILGWVIVLVPFVVIYWVMK